MIKTNTSPIQFNISIGLEFRTTIMNLSPGHPQAPQVKPAVTRPKALWSNKMKKPWVKCTLRVISFSRIALEDKGWLIPVVVQHQMPAELPVRILARSHVWLNLKVTLKQHFFWSIEAQLYVYICLANRNWRSYAVFKKLDMTEVSTCFIRKHYLFPLSLNYIRGSSDTILTQFLQLRGWCDKFYLFTYK